MAQLLLNINSAATNASRDRAVYNKIDVRLILPIIVSILSVCSLHAS